MVEVTKKVNFITYFNNSRRIWWASRRWEPLTPFTVTPSLRYCKLFLVNLSNTLTHHLEKLPTYSLACAFLYCSCGLYLRNWHSFRPNVSYCYKPYRTCSSSSSRKRNGWMDGCLWCRRECSSSIYNRHDGFEFGDWEFTTFVGIFHSRIKSSIFKSKSFFFPVDFWRWWLFWVLFGASYPKDANCHLKTFETTKKHSIIFFMTRDSGLFYLLATRSKRRLVIDMYTPTTKKNIHEKIVYESNY